MHETSKTTHLFPFDDATGAVVRHDRRCIGHLPPILLPHNIQVLGQPLVLQLILADVQVCPPGAGRIKAPVHRSVLQVAVRVADELLGRERAPAVQALDAPRLLGGVQVGDAQTGALAEALVVDGEGQGALWQVGRVGTGPVEQGAAQPLGVGFGDEAAGGRAAGQDALALQHGQLFRGAPGRKEKTPSDFGPE